jgi:glycosyltransferase involved in cell wall biosynthesis
MKVLILSPTKGLFDSQTSGYNGGGWVASLQRYIENDDEIELAMAFVSSQKLSKEKRGKTIYYPIFVEEKSVLQKLYYYRCGYKKDVFDKTIIQSIKGIIEDFVPDIIHIFGTESNFAYIVDGTDIPIIIHLQGLLCASSNIYYPSGLSKRNFMSLTNLREFWLSNGVVFNHNRMKIAAEREKFFLRKCKYIMGRTEWDREISKLYNPNVHYFHVDEVLRPEFYMADKWQFQGGKLRLVSILSPTLYKGFDIVLKTSNVLKEVGIEFEWNVIGISKSHKLISVFEKSYGLYSDELNINYLGRKQADEIIAILQNSTIYVHPSYTDNSPNSLCEAQYLGVPTIATNVGGIPTLMDYRQEYMSALVDSHSLAVKILNLYNVILNEEYVNPLTEMAIKRNNPKIIVERLKEVYHYIISDSN